MSNDGAIIINPEADRPKPSGVVEVVRSFSFKKNLGNYQSCDFFASQKAQCLPEEATEVSTDLYEWCMDQVMTSVREVEARMVTKKEAQKERSAA